MGVTFLLIVIVSESLPTLERVIETSSLTFYSSLEVSCFIIGLSIPIFVFLSRMLSMRIRILQNQPTPSIPPPTSSVGLGKTGQQVSPLGEPQSVKQDE